MMRVCGNPIFMLPITVYGRLLGKGGGVSCIETINKIEKKKWVGKQVVFKTISKNESH